MKRSQVSLVLAGGLALSMLGACAGPNLVKDGAVKVERRPTRHVAINHVGVYEKDGGTIVSGSIRRTLPRSPVAPEGHVDVALIDAAGNIVAESQDNYVPRRGQARMGIQQFITELPVAAPEGATVRVAHHAQAHQ